MGAAVAGAKAALEQFGNIADKSAAAGVDPEFFQGIAYQAKLSGVEIDGVAVALQAFAKNSGLAAIGQGDLFSKLKVLNPELLKQIELATTQEERIRLAADAIDHAGSAAEAAALSTALFGDSGTKLVAAFKGGAAEIDAMASKAKDMGLIVDRDLISRADELGDEFDTVTQIIDVQLKSALVNLAPVITGLGGMVAEWSKDLGIVLDQFKAIEDRKFVRPLQNELAGVYDERQPLGEKIGATEAMIARLGSNNPASATAGMELAADKKRYAELTAKAQQLLGRVQELQGLNATTPGVASGVTAPNFPAGSGLGGGGERNDAADAAIKQAEAVKQLVADLQFEQAQLGRTADEQELYNTLKQAGVDRESTYGQAIEAALTPLQQQRAEIQRNTDAMAEFSGIAQDALGTFIDNLIDGKSAGEALGSVLRNLGSQFLNAGLTARVGPIFTLRIAA